MICDLCLEAIEKKIEDDRIDLPFVQGVRLVRAHAVVFEILYLRLGKWVRKAAILTVMESHPHYVPRDHNREPDENLLNVWVCKLRRELRTTDFQIDTLWGVGYRLVDRRN